MKYSIFRMSIFLLLLMGSFSHTAYASPPGIPHLTLERSGLQVTANWETDQAATGYRLYYAPYPNMGTPSSMDMGEQRSFSISLWNDAAFYVWVTAYNTDGESQYSNIEHFVINNKVVAFLPRSSGTTTGTGSKLESGLKEAFSDITEARLETVFVDPNDIQTMKDLFFGTEGSYSYSEDPDVIAVVTATTAQTLALTAQHLDNPPLLISCTGSTSKIKGIDNVLALPADNSLQADLIYKEMNNYAKDTQQQLKYAILLSRQPGISFYAYDLYAYLLAHSLIEEIRIQENQGLGEAGQPEIFAQLVGTFLYDESSGETDSALALLDKAKPDIVVHIGFGRDLLTLVNARPNFIWVGSDASYSYELYKGKSNVAVVALHGGIEDYGYDAGGFLKEVFSSLSGGLLTRTGILDMAKHIIYDGRTGHKGFDTGDKSGSYDLLIPGPQDWLNIAPITTE